MAEADVIRALQDKQAELTTGIDRLEVTVASAPPRKFLPTLG
jgi:hypothetical protein